MKQISKIYTTVNQPPVLLSQCCLKNYKITVNVTLQCQTLNETKYSSRVRNKKLFKEGEQRTQRDITTTRYIHIVRFSYFYFRKPIFKECYMKGYIIQVFIKQYSKKEKKGQRISSFITYFSSLDSKCKKRFNVINLSESLKLP